MYRVQNPAIRFGLTGLGGYAAYACDRLVSESIASGSSAQLVAVSEPELERFPRRREDLRAKGITVVRDFTELLDLPIDAVWLPLPIDLHLGFTATALSAGKAVLCEKPAAGCVDDVDRMMAARDHAALPVAIGFQDVYQPMVAILKNRLLSGEFGKAISARIIGCWPRSERYFGRNAWAGRLRRDGRWVMDSPASNALAHFLHLTLFLLGPTRQESAQATAVAAELYRANRIENYDTCSMRFTVADNVPVHVAYTHACATSVDPLIVIDTERAQIRYLAGRQIEIRISGETELLRLSSNPYKFMFSAFQSWFHQGPDAALGATLEMARAHVVAVNAASEGAPVVTVPPSHIEIIPAPDQTPLRAIRDIVSALNTCTTEQCLLNQTGRVPWSYPSVSKGINGYAHFAGPAAPQPPGMVEAKTFVTNVPTAVKT